MNITTKQFLSYTFLPGLFPRFKDLFSLGFAHLAFFVALIFESVKLLPSNHVYLRPENFGKFSVGQVLVQSYKRLKFDRNHIDQIFIFGTICTGIVLFFGQLIVLAFSMMFPFAQAAVPATLSDIIDIGSSSWPNRDDDIAFMLLDRVFGVDDFFNSRIDPVGAGAGGFPYPYHAGLHVMFLTYSTAMLVVALLVLTYFVTTIFAETVRDGTAFGKRFNRVWAVIRLVVAMGLLVPINSGLNAGQYIVLVAAKWGSNFATNGMGYYYDEIAGEDSPWGDAENLIATPSPPDPSNLIHFMLVARACQYATQAMVRTDTAVSGLGVVPVNHPIDGYLIRPGASGLVGVASPYFDGATNFTATPGAFEAMIRDTGFESVIITFGDQNPDLFSDFTGDVYPFCGTISLPLATSVDAAGTPSNAVAFDIQQRIMGITSIIWHDTEIVDAAAAIAAQKLPSANICGSFHLPAHVSCPPGAIPDMADLKAQKVQQYKDFLRSEINAAITANVGSLELCGPASDPFYKKYGWAGAAICYNKIPGLNGAITTAATTLPNINHWPKIMEDVAVARAKDAASIAPTDRFNPYVSGSDDVIDVLEGTGDQRYVAFAGHAAYKAWLGDGTSGTGTTGTPALSGMGIIDIINMIFGTEGVFNMLSPENRDVHPMALLASAGRGLVEATIRNLGGGAVGIGLAVFAEAGGLGTAISGFMMTIATITIVAGFVLFYLIPLMPFIYFYFAVAGWIKGIFEAMVGVPLWALAHIRIDGDGLPGNAAMNGYLLILEIFLRPIFIFFGLLASAIIFYAQVKVLNELWSLVVYNVAGFDQDAARTAGFTDIEFWRGPIDEFFYTIIYVIIVYMIATASFKLVDLIPNFMLRWMGQSVEAFGETVGDPAARLSQQATVGFSGVSSQMIQGVEQGGRAVEALGQGLNRAAEGPPASARSASTTPSST